MNWKIIQTALCHAYTVVNPVQRNARSVILTTRVVHMIEPGAARKRITCPLPLRFPLRVLGLARLLNQHREHIDPDIPRAVHDPWQIPQGDHFSNPDLVKVADHANVCSLRIVILLKFTLQIVGIRLVIRSATFDSWLS